MGKKLIITEKPSVARDIAAALGGFTDHTEYQESKDYVVTFALGHLLELAEPEDYDKSLRAWTVQSLPIIPSAYQIKPREGQKKRLDIIRKLGHRADVDGVINACDAGREGEVIFRRIYEFCELTSKPHQRLWLQSMTTDAIRAGFVQLRPGEALNGLADAAWLRGVGDWLIGMNSTRALTRRLKGKKERGSWSAGRVQTPTLGLLVAREHQILAHEPRTFWEIGAEFSADGQRWTGRFHDPGVSESEEKDHRPGRIFDRARVDSVLAGFKAARSGIAGEKRKKSRQNPPLLFDLTALQREANRRFSFSAKRTLNAAQRLYEGHKVLTYPRTDSKHLPGDYGPTVAAMLSALSRDADYAALATRIEAEGPKNLEILLDNSKVSDHFAIVPTGAEPPGDMSPDDQRIYDLVVRQFLAAVMGPATWATVERIVEVPVGAELVHFRTTARSLEVPGFLEALGHEQGDGTTLPPLVPGQDVAAGVQVMLLEARDEQKETRPPSRHTESALLRLMEVAGEQLDDEELVDAMQGRGLGTPATRADIIERLIQTGYATRVEGKLAPTPKGMRLMDILERAKVPVLGSARLTGEWEHKLKQVEEGQLTRAENLAQLEAFTREVTQALAGFDHDALYAGDPPLGTCPSCGLGQVVETPWGYRCSRNRNDGEGGCKLFLWKERNGRYIDRALATKLVNERRAERVAGFTDRFGRVFEGRIVLEPDDPAPGSQWTMRVEFGAASEGEGAEVVSGVVFPCPCGAEDCEGIVETSLRFVCQRLLDGRAKAGPVVPRVVCGRAMEAEEVEPFFGTDAATPFFDGFISRRGRPFSGRLVRRATGKHGFEFPERAGAVAKGAEGAEGGEAEGAKGGRRRGPPRKKGGEPEGTPAKAPAKKPRAVAKAPEAGMAADPATPAPKGTRASKAPKAAPGSTAAPKGKNAAAGKKAAPGKKAAAAVTPPADGSEPATVKPTGARRRAARSSDGPERGPADEHAES